MDEDPRGAATGVAAAAVAVEALPGRASPAEQALREVVEAAGLPDGVRLRLGGTADALTATARELKLDLVLAFAIVFLVMAVLFESFFYPLIIVLSVPVAAAGGVIGLKVLNLYRKQWGIVFFCSTY